MTPDELETRILEIFGVYTMALTREVRAEVTLTQRDTPHTRTKAEAARHDRNAVLNECRQELLALIVAHANAPHPLPVLDAQTMENL